MKNVKKVLTINLFVLAFLFFFTNSVIAEEGETERLLKGVKYSGELHAVLEKEDLDTELNLKHINIENGLFSMEGKIIDNKKEYELDLKGEIYRSNIKVLLDSNANSYTIIPNNSVGENIEVLSVSLEEKAYKGLLLPANYGLEGNKIIKMALKVDSNVYYFEDKIEGISFSELASHSETVEKSDINDTIDKKGKKEIEDKLEKINESAGWFAPYLKSNHENVNKHSIKQGIENNRVSSVEEEESCADPRWEPICGMGIYYFRNPGADLVTHYSDIGFYKDTVSYPTGSENTLTSFMKWTYVDEAPANDLQETDNTGSGKAALIVTDEGRYFFNAETSEATYYSEGDSGIRLENPEVQVVIDSDYIIYDVTRIAEVKDGPSKINYLSLMGLAPYGKFIGMGQNMYNNLNYKPVSYTTDRIIYHSTVEENVNAFGDAIRSFQNSLEEDHYLTLANDQLGFDYTIIVPEDKERETGFAADKFRFSFDVYYKDFYAFWNLVGEVEQDLTDSYRVY